jgi:cysteine desulfuration protein SufE
VNILEIEEAFNQSHSKEDSFRALVKISKTLHKIETDQKTSENAVTGCESQAWLVAKQDVNTALWHFKADSDAKLIRGFLAIILAHTEGLTSEEIQKLDLISSLDKLNLGAYLTSSRNNGIRAIISKIQQLTLIR